MPEGVSIMGFSRRELLGLAAGLTVSGIAPARAAGALSFQLSWIKSIQYGGYFAAIDQGFYTQAGIEPTFNSGGPNLDAVANVASGQSGLGDRPIGSILVAKDKGMPLKVIGTVFQKSPYAVLSLAKTPIKTVKELVGKTLSVSVSSRPLMLNMLRDAGVDPRDVNMVPAAADPSGLVSGQFDAYAGYSTNQGVMLQTRGVDIYAMNLQDLGIPETTGTIYGREDFLAANRDLVVRFLKASALGWRWALDHPEQIAHLMVDKYGAPGLDYTAQMTEIKVSKPYIEAGVGTTHGLLALDVPLYARIIELYRNVGLLKSDMKVTDLVDTSFVDAALTS
jgi:NitT/TauT family transport system substrate-binding protein